LNRTDLLPLAQSEALLREIEQQTKDEMRTIADTAEREARAIIAQAHATARRQMHGAIEELRREGERRLAQARAQLETEARVRAQQRAVEAIRQAWPLLVEALAARWQDAAARRKWTDGVAREARDRLKAATWTVEHDAGWGADEQRQFREALGAGANLEISFAIDPELDAGLRVRADQATLDASPQGLLADNSTIAALLLYEIDRGRGG
jgi:F0F1-type ATP synthase membrane subunit b/b'